MSRIGKNPVEVPAEIKVSVDGAIVSFVKGNNTRTLDTRGNVAIELDGQTLTFKNLSDSKVHRAFWGTYRALSANIVKGLTVGFAKQLEINGVGYRAAVKGKVLNLQLGHSHDINYDIREGLEMSVEKNVITIKGSDNQMVGQAAAEIRAFRPPEPYKGKGVKYMEEHIVRKAGKTSKK
ncbi:MAG: 50S ribosomal protein L6 [Helicobacteraceae bacterium]|jgi:large subunit ribosomal protein L6|nr:50S ribosomal protein L6 [Helicobacteraceae bacterium]